MASKPFAWSFLEFCDVLGLQLSPGQRVVVRVAFDGAEPCEVPAGEREIARKIFGDVDTIPPMARAVFAAICGARGGKSRVFAATYSLWRMLTANLSALAPGERATALIVAPDMRLGRQTLSFALGAAKEVDLFRRCIASESADGFSVKRPDGHTVVCEVLPATRGGSALRGRSLVSAVLEEAAFFRDENAAINDVECYRAVAPRVLAGGLTVVATTAWAQSGLAYDTWRDNWGNPQTALVAHAPTLLLNPSKRDEVERERKRDPANAELEFDAVFAAGEEQLLTHADVAAMIDRGVTERPVQKDGSGWPLRYAIGLDVGLRHDRSAIVVTHRERDPANAALDPIIVDACEILTPEQYGGRIPLDAVEAAVVRLSRRYNGAKVYHDIHLSDALAPRLAQQGVRCIEVAMSSAPQGERASLLVQRARSGLLRLVDNPVLERELKELVVTRHSGGRLSIAAPKRRGAHDDAADALLLSLEASLELPAHVPAGEMSDADRMWLRREQRRLFRDGGVHGFGAGDTRWLDPEDRAAVEAKREMEDLKAELHALAESGDLPRI